MITFGNIELFDSVFRDLPNQDKLKLKVAETTVTALLQRSTDQVQRSLNIFIRRFGLLGHPQEFKKQQHLNQTNQNQKQNKIK
jgi:hypothetical protein